MTRRIAALMAIAAALVVGGCGGDDDSGDSAKKSATPEKIGGTVRLWVMNNGPKPVQDTEKIVKPFEQRTGVDVKVELVGWDVQFDRIRNSAVSGNAPDVTQAGTTQVPFFAALGGFDDLSGRVKDLGGEKAYAPGVWNTTKVAGQDGIWAAPWFTEARAIYYRKDALEKAGIDPATAFTDWEAFSSTLSKLKSVDTLGGKKMAPFGAPGKKAFDLVHNVMPFVWDAGGTELSEDSKKSTIAEPAAVQGVKYFADLLPAGVYDKTALERDGTQVENMFKGGRLAVWIGGPWVLASSERSDDPAWTKDARENFGVAPMPTGPSGKGYTFVGGSNLMMFKSSKNKAAAWELVKYLSQDQTQTDYASLMGMFPARVEAQQEQGNVDANHEAFLKAILDQGRTYAPIPQWGQIENAYKGRFGSILDNAADNGASAVSEESIRGALEDAAKEADGLLAQSTG
jgi:multiple sugar transport system substrate-binding protein